MPKLLVRKKSEVIKELSLKGEQETVTVGSGKENDLVISDKMVSDNHFQIVRQSHRYFVQDLSSAFGTYLNGDRLQSRAEIKNGDILQVGDHQVFFDNPLQNIDLTFLDQARGETGKPDGQNGNQVLAAADMTKLKALEEAIRKEAANLGQPATSSRELAPFYLLAIHGPYKGKRYQLRYGETKIGRDENLNDIVLNKSKRGESDQSISRRHATITHKNGAFFISDKRSKTRTLVNQIAVPTDEEIQLYPKDEIEIVSDRQSTIFRFANEGALDFSSPKKAGIWWIRYQSKFYMAIAALLLLFSGMLLSIGFRERTMIVQKPRPLKLELARWVTDKSMVSEAVPSQQVDKQIPALADFNGDGFTDILTTNVANKPVLMDGQTLEPLWIIDTQPAARASSFVTADFNHDGFEDLIYLSQDGRIVCFDGTIGAEVWTSPFFQEKVTGPPVIADFDGDQLLDAAISDESGRIHLGFNRIYSVEWNQIDTEVPMKSVLSAADLDNNGKVEIIAGSERGLVLILDPSEKRIIDTIDVNDQLNRVRGTFYEDNKIRYPVGVADLDADQTPDLVISSIQGRILALSGVSKKRIWHDVIATSESDDKKPFPMALGDFDGNASFDVVVGTEAGEIRVYDGRGDENKPTVIWEHRVADGDTIPRQFVVGDITKDAISDLLFVGASGTLTILDGSNGRTLLTEKQPVPGRATIPLAADLQNDGFVDVLLFSETGVTFQYRSNCRIPKSAVFWGQRFGGSRNTLSQVFELPRTAKANISMASGFLLFVGVGATALIMKRKKKNT